jgi:hypothetical protein
MAYNLQINIPDLSININSKYQNMSNYKRPVIVATAPNGKVAKESSVYQGNVLRPGSTQRQWVDEDDKQYAKAELTFSYEGEEVAENSMTKVFHVEQFQPLPNYTDMYIIDKYYELTPSDNGTKKDIDREIARKLNLSQMYKLWEHLTTNDTVARGEFCTSSRGFVASDGYIRAISIEGKWGLEIGVFKEEKIFEHLNEGKPTAVQAASQAGGRKRLKLV